MNPDNTPTDDDDFSLIFFFTIGLREKSFSYVYMEKMELDGTAVRGGGAGGT